MVKVKTYVDDLPEVKEKVRTRIDLTNQRFGKLVAKERVVKKRDNGRKIICYNCVCDCGNEFLYPMQYLRNGQRRDCGCEKPIVHLGISEDLNYKNENYYKKYKKRYRRTSKGYLRNLYHGMNERNRNKGFGDLPFSLDDFVNKYIKHYDFVMLFEIYMNSDFDKNYAPSIDRINPNLGYFYENMQFITWKDNKEKGYKEGSRMRSRSVNMFDYKTGELLMTFNSANEASHHMNLQQSNIVKNLKGIRNKVKNYNFEYADEQESDIYLKIKSVLRKC